MAKIILKSMENEEEGVYYVSPETTVTIEAKDVVTLDEMLNLFTTFLRACGFSIGDGQLTIEFDMDEDEEVYVEEEEEEEEADMYSADDADVVDRFKYVMDKDINNGEEEDYLSSTDEEGE